jgi:hypothetical protein
MYTFKGYFEEDIWHMGAAVDYGKMKVEEFYGGGGASNNNMHMVFGCPELDIYCETSPLPVMTVDYPASIAPGVFDVTVSNSLDALIEGALVGVSQNSVLLDGGYTNSSGVASLNITSIPTGDDCDVVVTYHNHHPWAGTVPVSGTGVGDGGIASVLSLGRMIPNPVSVSAQISYTLPVAGDARLQVFDLSGRMVSTVTEGEQPAGIHTITWNADDGNGHPVPDGVYFYRLTTPEGSLVRSCVVIR